MSVCRAFLFSLFAVVVIPFQPPNNLAQENSTRQGGCSVLDRSKPPLFISFESPTGKAWAGGSNGKGVLLRLTNNTNCTVSITADYGTAPSNPSAVVIRGGKIVRPPDVRFGSVRNGQRVCLSYFTKYPKQQHPVIGCASHLVETAYLNGGDYVFFDVPLMNFRKGGEIFVPYNYEWDEGEASEIVTEKGGNKRRFQTVEHHLRFAPEQLPENFLR